MSRRDRGLDVRLDRSAHAYWLSETKFREYYQLLKPEGEGR